MQKYNTPFEQESVFEQKVVVFVHLLGYRLAQRESGRLQ
jgi:hypothetical protein